MNGCTMWLILFSPTFFTNISQFWTVKKSQNRYWWKQDSYICSLIWWAYPLYNFIFRKKQLGSRSMVSQWKSLNDSAWNRWTAEKRKSLEVWAEFHFEWVDSFGILEEFSEKIPKLFDFSGRNSSNIHYLYLSCSRLL